MEFALATPVVLWAGWPFLERGWASIVHRSPNMFTLIAMGTGAAYLYSVVAVLAPALFPPSFRDGTGETAGSISKPPPSLPCSCCWARCWSCRARSQTNGAIQALLGLAPKTARRIAPTEARRTFRSTKYMPGDRLRVRPGEKVPVDGR